MKRENLSTLTNINPIISTRKIRVLGWLEHFVRISTQSQTHQNTTLSSYQHSLLLFYLLHIQRHTLHSSTRQAEEIYAFGVTQAGYICDSMRTSTQFQAHRVTRLKTEGEIFILCKQKTILRIDNLIFRIKTLQFLKVSA